MTLEHLKKNPEKKSRFDNQAVRIWSGKWQAWWNPGAGGYTDDISRAAVYSFEDAWARSSHCSARKKISYEIVR